MGQAGANRDGPRWAPQNDQWNLGLSLSMPIFEGGLRLAQVSQAHALLNQLQANERSTRDGVVLALEQAWVALQDAIGTVDVQYKGLVAAQERAKIAEAECGSASTASSNWPKRRRSSPAGRAWAARWNSISWCCGCIGRSPSRWSLTPTP